MNLTEAVKAGLHDNRSDEQREQIAAEYEDFHARFPRDRWKTMTKEEYALGLEHSRESYSYAVEFGSVHLGSIAGGSAKKHRLFFRRNDGEWYYPNGFDSADEAWEALRAAFLRLFELADRGEWSETSNVEQLRTVHMIRMKALYLYFSDQVLPCYSKDHLKHFAAELGLPAASDIIVLNRRILERLRAEPGLENVSGVSMMRMLYDVSPPPGYVTDTYVKITAPEDEEAWEQWRRDGFAAVRWGRAGDLAQFETQQEFGLAFRDVYPSRVARKGRIAELWRIRDLTPGTHIVAARGTSEVLGIGVVTEPGYIFDQTRDEHAHTVSVAWDGQFRRTLDEPIPGWGNRDVVELNKRQVEVVLADVAGAEQELERVQDVVDPRFVEWERILERKKQLIFYGPPGTGKTFHAKRFLRWFLDRKHGGDGTGKSPVSDTLSEITFHASYSYEEFVEGYRPVSVANNGGPGGLHLELRSGVFTKLAGKARDRHDETFALLIDEFNRANVPQVFGELLTVIEADKRGDGVVLPGSGERFDVPKNLYVVGTMNTADRSIRSLDAALRRRFGFVELMPDSRALVGSALTELDLPAFLDDLNEKVTRLAGRERQIGHALFMIDGDPVDDVEQFVEIMRSDIIPLLQEMVYDDYRQLADYLGEKIVDVEGRALNGVDSSEFVTRLLEHYQAGDDAA